MGDIAKLIEVLTTQHKEQMEEQERCHRQWMAEQARQSRKQEKEHEERMAILLNHKEVKDDELMFLKAYQVAQEVEEAGGVAKETVYGATSKPVHKVGQPKSRPIHLELYAQGQGTPGKLDQPISKVACGRCGKKTHTGKDCPHINDVCHYCKRRDTCNPF